MTKELDPQVVDPQTSGPTLRTAEQEHVAEQRTSQTLEVIDSLSELISEEIEAPGELPADFLLSVVIPVFNEERTICRVVGSLFTLHLPLEIIIVDDGSTDGTCALLTELNRRFPSLQVVFQPSNQGKGAAVRRGFLLTHGSHVMIQDADLEYDPRDIPNLVEPLLSGEVDVVYGSRFLEPLHQGSSWLHRTGNRFLTAASNRVTGWQLTDMETGYKIFRREFLDQIQLEQDGFGFEVEFTSKLANLGARVTERPIRYHARGWAAGKKINWQDGLHALYCILKYR